MDVKSAIVVGRTGTLPDNLSFCVNEALRGSIVGTPSRSIICQTEEKGK